MKKTLRKTLFILAKFVLAAMLLFWVLHDTDWHKMWHDVLNSDRLLLCLGAVSMLVGSLICAYRLQILLKVQEIPVRLGEIVRLTFLGQFFNNVIPGSVGGDLIKAYYLAKHTPHKARTLVAVFVDRVMGLAALAIMAASMVILCLVAHLGERENIIKGAVATAILIGVIVLACIFLFVPRVRKLFHLQKIYGRLSFAHHFKAASEGANLFRHHPMCVIEAVAVSFISQTFWIGSIWMMGEGLHIQGVPWHQYFLYVPLIYVLGAVPITPGGLGVVEKCYLTFLGLQAAKDASEAVKAMVNSHNLLVKALSLLARLTQILWSLPGIVVALQGARVPKAEAMEAELALDESPAQA